MTKVENRHKKILEILAHTPLTTIAELSEKLNVSNETIRKDLKVISGNNTIVQTHGGVALRENKTISQPFDYRMKINSKSKEIVGEMAAELIEDGDVVLLENSTTSLALAIELCKNKELLNSVVIVTSSFKIAALLDEVYDSEVDHFHLFFIGGWTNFGQHATFGQYALDTLKVPHINKAFISGAALNNKLELTGYIDDDIAFQKKAIASADEVVLMLEKGKYPKSAIMNVAEITAIHYIVTDVEFDNEAKKMLEKAKVTVKNPKSIL